MEKSLRDVAARAGVSFQTVSKVLNGTGSISAATRQRVLQAAKELNYVPNALARGLLKGSSGTIGVVSVNFGDAAGTMLAQHIVGIEREARKHGFGVLISCAEPTGQGTVECIRALEERRVDGLVVNVPATETDLELGELLRGSIPSVSLHGVAGGGVSTVTPDDRQSALAPTQHLVSLGHTVIAMITGDPHRAVTQTRSSCYREVLANSGLTTKKELVDQGDWDVRSGVAATHRLLDRAPDLTAIYAHSDLMAFGTLTALRERGRRVPEDVSVVGCDDIPLAAHAAPPLTTVQIPFYEIGEVAVRTLIQQIGSEVRDETNEVIPVRMIHRSSTGPVR